MLPVASFRFRSRKFAVSRAEVFPRLPTHIVPIEKYHVAKYFHNSLGSELLRATYPDRKIQSVWDRILNKPHFVSPLVIDSEPRNFFFQCKVIVLTRKLKLRVTNL